MSAVAPSQKIAVVAGVRTPFAKAFGPLRSAGADDLGTAAMRELLARTDLDVRAVDEVILGCVGQPTDAMNVARVVALRSGIPKEVPAYTVHRNCASAMEAITSGAEKILTGQAEVVIAGGTESMSNIPVKANSRYVAYLEKLQRAKGPWQKVRAAAGFRPKMLAVKPALEEGLTDKTCGMIMGMTAEKLVREFAISREEQDRYALASHQKVAQAYSDNRFANEVMPYVGPPTYEALNGDVGYRANQTMEALAKLKPYFDRLYGTVTVGNACPITDGAVVLLMMPLEKAKAEGYDVLGVLEGYAYAGLDPERMGLGPVYATSKLLDKLGMEMSDVDLFELNEAFAAQVLACLKAFQSERFAQRQLGRTRALGELPPERLNVNGGAVALGHPVGATGARLVLTLLNELERRNLERGVATLCVGGGLGAALSFTREVDATRQRLMPEKGTATASTRWISAVQPPAAASGEGNGMATVAGLQAEKDLGNGATTAASPPDGQRPAHGKEGDRSPGEEGSTPTADRAAATEPPPATTTPAAEPATSTSSTSPAPGEASTQATSETTTAAAQGDIAERRAGASEDNRDAERTDVVANQGAEAAAGATDRTTSEQETSSATQETSSAREQDASSGDAPGSRAAGDETTTADNEDAKADKQAETEEKSPTDENSEGPQNRGTTPS